MEKSYEELVRELAAIRDAERTIAAKRIVLESQIEKLNKKKAANLYKEISDKMSELENLGYHFEVQIWNNEYDTYEWYDTTANNHNFRYRYKDTIIVD